MDSWNPEPPGNISRSAPAVVGAQCQILHFSKLFYLWRIGRSFQTKDVPPAFCDRREGNAAARLNQSINHCVIVKLKEVNRHPWVIAGGKGEMDLEDPMMEVVQTHIIPSDEQIDQDVIQVHDH